MHIFCYTYKFIVYRHCCCSISSSINYLIWWISYNGICRNNSVYLISTDNLCFTNN